jgi:hypothetical protein
MMRFDFVQRGAVQRVGRDRVQLVRFDSKCIPGGRCARDRWMVRMRTMDSTRIDYTSSWEADGGFPSRATRAERKAVMEAPEWEAAIDFMLAFGYSLRILAADRSAKFHASGGGPALLLERNGGTVSICEMGRHSRSRLEIILEALHLSYDQLIWIVEGLE